MTDTEKWVADTLDLCRLLKGAISHGRKQIFICGFWFGVNAVFVYYNAKAGSIFSGCLNLLAAGLMIFMCIQTMNDNATYKAMKREMELEIKAFEEASKTTR